MIALYLELLLSSGIYAISHFALSPQPPTCVHFQCSRGSYHINCHLLINVCWHLSTTGVGTCSDLSLLSYWYRGDIRSVCWNKGRKSRKTAGLPWPGPVKARALSSSSFNEAIKYPCPSQKKAHLEPSSPASKSGFSYRGPSAREKQDLLREQSPWERLGQARFCLE